MIRVSSSTRDYDVLFTSLEQALGELPASSFVVTDENVAGALQISVDRPLLKLPPGEKTKSLEYFGQIQSWLAQHGASRKSTLVALGGGVIGDLVGFAASAYMRGIELVQIPTSLLAQVDSSVGGKVAIDIPEGKNLVGAFYPPSRVYICLETLKHLPPRQLRNGMAEVWKYGFIMDPQLVADLELWDPTELPDLSSVVDRCIRLKAQVVAEDEFETTGRRAILNFGHTVAHAIEQVTNYGPILHGEAVAIGMCVEAHLGEFIGLTAAGTEQRIHMALKKSELPTTADVLKEEDLLIQAMRKDKKASSGNLAFSLVCEIGQCKLVDAVPEQVVRQALRRYVGN